jgi:hypothetical protein
MLYWLNHEKTSNKRTQIGNCPFSRLIKTHQSCNSEWNVETDQIWKDKKENRKYFDDTIFYFK